MFNFGLNFNTFASPVVNYYGIGLPQVLPVCFNMQSAIQTPIPFNNSIFMPNGNEMPYNRAKGEALLQNAIAGLPAKAPNPPLCARYFNKALVNTGLGAFSNANGEQTQYELRQNMNFKEVIVPGSQLSKLPAGTTIVYDAFDSSEDKNGNVYNIGKFGHVLVAKGDGTAISDRFESSIPPSNKAHVFIPV